MPYGRPISRGHGRREPDYDWTEDYSFLDRFARHFEGNVCTGNLPRDVAETMNTLTFAIVTEGFVLAVLLLAAFVDMLYRAATRKRAKAVAIEAACRRRLRKRRIECVRGAPTPRQLLDAWAESRTSLAGKLRLGALLSEIEPHVDQSLIRDEGGHVVGRRPGIRGWLRENCPLLAAHYKTAMGYKALADKVQAAIGLPSKYSIVDVIDVLTEFGGNAAAETAAAAEGEGAKGALREMMGALGRRSLRELDGEVCYRLGLVRMRRLKRRDVG